MLRTRRLHSATIFLVAIAHSPGLAAVAPGVLAAADARVASTFASRGVAYPPRAVTLIALKAEARLELWADAGSGWTFVRSYLVSRSSGRLGPKLARGDHQVPEGVYAIDALNPASRFHLALRVAYPNDFDRARASDDGRRDLGGDIMIHGGSLSDGCLPVGDAAVEELYALASRVGTGNVTAILSPVDLRRVEPSIAATRVVGQPRWIGPLYATIADALRPFALPAGDDAPAPARRLTEARPACKPYDAVDCVARCEKGDAQSCARAGLMFRRGRSLAAEASRAWTLLTRACAGGAALGCAELRQLYLTDDGLRRDASRAAALATLACDAGDGHACRDLVELCAARVIYPSTDEQCSADALRRLSARAVASLRHDCSGWGAYDCDTLAAIYAPGDRETALRFASRSCQEGDPGGCDDLARLYEDAGNIEQARTLYRRACDAGYTAACDRVGSSRAG